MKLFEPIKDSDATCQNSDAFKPGATDDSDVTMATYSAPKLFVIGKAADMIKSGYGYHPDSSNTSVNRP